MKKLWAPWRMKYIASIGKPEKGCIFCQKPKQKNDRKNLILFRSQHCFVIMNLFPYNNGHLLVVPYRHTAKLTDLDEKTRTDLFHCIDLAVDALKKTMRPEGFNIGLNLGRASGAGIDKHLHFHVVPRWNGDTHFMPILCDTKVISEGLEETYQRLEKEFRA